ncbi:MAG: dockerin type I domain-containing protein [Haloarculaceae archaeon]
MTRHDTRRSTTGGTDHDHAARAVTLVAVLLVGTLGGVVGAATVAAQGPTVSAGDASVAVGETTTIPVVLDEAPDGLAGFNVSVTVDDASTATIVDASVSDQFALADPTADSARATLVAVDLNGNVEAGATDVRLGTVTVRGETDGSTDLTVTIGSLDDDDGTAIDAGTDSGTLTVGDRDGETSTPTPTPTSGGPTVSAGDASVAVGETTTVPVVLSEAPDGLAGFDVTVSVADGETATVVDASVSDQFGLSDPSTGDGEATLVASDTNGNVEAGVTDIRLGTVTVRGEMDGSTDLTVTINQLDADGGARIDAGTDPGTLSVGDDTGTPSDGPAVSAGDASVAVGETTTIPVVLNEAPDGLAGFNVSVSVEESGTATVVDASVSDQFGLSDPTADSARATLVAADTNGNVEAGATDVRLGTVTVRGEADGTTDLSVTINQLDADGGARIDAGTDPGTLTVGGTTGGEGTTLRLVPSEGTAPLGGTTTYELVVGEVTGGVGSYAVDVSVADPTTATIAAASNEIGGTGEVEIGSNNASVRVGAFAGDTVDSGTNVTIATVTVRGQRRGSTTLAIEPTSVSDEGGTQYELGRAVGATVAVREIERPAPVGESESRPRDPDDDGVYEDLNGDGDVLPGDATVLFDAVFEGEIPSDDTRFDINDDGSVTPGDATVLFREAFAS